MDRVSPSIVSQRVVVAACLAVCILLKPSESFSYLQADNHLSGHPFRCQQMDERTDWFDATCLIGVSCEYPLCHFSSPLPIPHPFHSHPSLLPSYAVPMRMKTVL